MNPTPLHTKLKNAVRIDRALRFVWQASPVYTILSGVIVLVLGMLPLLSLYLIKLIIDAVTALDFTPDTGMFDPAFATPLLYIGLACG
ncbi:MAG: hypothetical protein LC657_14665, partial [Desulfobacteraceae bacterium]|nr:hypothetical protein [Desulfobacteraceae bacterium]